MRFRTSLLLGLPILFFALMLLLGVTNSVSSPSNKLQLDDGSVLQVIHIKRHELPFTNRWLRRYLEILVTSPAGKETIFAHRVSPLNLPNEELAMFPKIEFNGPKQIQVSLIDRTSREVKHTILLPIPDEI